MRLLICFFLLCSLPALARKDTIPISDLDKELFGESELERILSNGSQPINFFYSNVFKYRLQPYTGMAIGESSSNYTSVVEFREGRIIALKEYVGAYIRYSYRRIDSDSLLAVDSTHVSYAGKAGVWSEKSRLYYAHDSLRVKTCYGPYYISNGYYRKCKGGKTCTDDGWESIEVRDGYQRENCWNSNCYWREAWFENGVLASAWTAYFADSTVSAVYHETANGLKQGLYVDFWPNGKICRSGFYIAHREDGKWVYYDSSGILLKEDWYSADKMMYGTFLDSTCEYYSNGNRKYWFEEVYKRDSCFDPDVHEELFIDESANFRVTRSYYENGSPKDVEFDVDSECGYTNQDTLYAQWYASGQLEYIERNGTPSIRYFQNGKINSVGVSRWDQVRHDSVVIFDSTGKVLIDRTYNKGKLLNVRDTNYYHIDSVRLALAKQVAGAAVLGLFPHNYVMAGGSEPYNFYHAPDPAWRDSLYVPAGIIDSIAYTAAGALLALPDTIDMNRVLEFAVNFHPNPSEWIYTVHMLSTDTAQWIATLQRGLINTGNYSANDYLQRLNPEILSWKIGGTAVRFDEHNKHIEKRWCMVVIKISRPINLMCFHRMLFRSECDVRIYCGTIESPCYEYRLIRNTSYSYEYTIDEKLMNAYSVFYVVNRQCHPDHGSSFQFYINSDQTVDRSKVWKWPAPWLRFEYHSPGRE
jgi:antitoxin component YwqK of YwqJK toxin-antitoxin module